MTTLLEVRLSTPAAVGHCLACDDLSGRVYRVRLGASEIRICVDCARKMQGKMREELGR
jgi:ribosome-binding protein aMBF1 (putative translation factor)